MRQNSSLPWDTGHRADTLFRRVLVCVFVSFIAIGIALSYIKLPTPENFGYRELPARYVELLMEFNAEKEAEEAAAVEEEVAEEELEPEIEEPEPEVEEPEPVIEEEPVPEEEPAPEEEPTPESEPVEPVEAPEVAEPVDIPEPSPEPVVEAPAPTEEEVRAAARERVADEGLLALGDSFADLLDIETTDDSQPLYSSSAGSENDSQANSSDDSSLLASSSTQSSGISTPRRPSTAAATRDTQLTEHQTERVASPVKAPVAVASRVKAQSVPQGDDPDADKQQRTQTELKLAIDRYQGRFYKPYLRALREDPELRGKLKLNITVDPSGKVTDIEIISSDLDDPDLEEKIVGRMMTINFGAKKVPTITFSYTLDFVPT